MKKLLLLSIPILILSCGSSRKNGPDVPPTITSTMVLGQKYGYTEEMVDMTYAHFVEFLSDSQAGILLGGDVVSLAHYDIHFDTIQLRVLHTEPVHTKSFLYTDSGLVDRKGTLWKPMQ